MEEVFVPLAGFYQIYKVSYNVGDKNQGAWLVQRYCQSCFDKWKDTTKWKKRLDVQETRHIIGPDSYDDNFNLLWYTSELKR